ncbi:SpaH/EbpB family LPXTG-anchored major pilin [Arthrobacter gengyunqii]|uniref:SpaH/EbpB family LPXTG-anchored major pilin n=1 Tax=Arthrobacter gengyunqii TaxID=2886940 RepID=A0ABS8GGN4_9MICC|nr:SpaH/EbpB family LPXTG-anchored major pilin [Arthrobacter gengyunqii]MCC3265626.1 SpaH/EbpB family LPXTG-anchored major pilin [Arthrobacter gengyunqii]
METKQRGLRWRSATALAAGVLTALLGVSAPAHASPVVDATQQGSLTVHKFHKPDAATGLPNNGTAVTSGLDGLTPLAGVEFTVEQVNPVDLSTNAGWQAAEDISKVFDPANPAGSIPDASYALGTAKTAVTDSTGSALFDNLDLGLYLVTETSYPAGVTPAAPFLVTVPLTDPNPNQRDGWLYDVHVYPKNSVSTLSKTVTDNADAKVGDEIDFTITGDIPNETVIDGYKIVDALDKKLEYVRANVTLTNGTAITKGTHFTVVHDIPSNRVTVEFTAAGRQVLAANHTSEVQVSLTAKVTAAGEIDNQALLYPNAPSFNVTPGDPNGPTPSPTVSTKWGGLTVQKTNDTGAALAGAKFSVFTSRADAVAGANAVPLDGQTVFTTAADGTLTLSGLRYSDWADGKEITDTAAFQKYYLVEVQAPAGYELLAQPIEFTVTAATTAAGVDLQVKNVPSNGGFELPLTGGTGTALLYAAGALLVGGAVALFLSSRRRAKN